MSESSVFLLKSLLCIYNLVRPTIENVILPAVKCFFLELGNFPCGFVNHFTTSVVPCSGNGGVCWVLVSASANLGHT
jgi:hypothetical protein